jgi:hypothetical protein
MASVFNAVLQIMTATNDFDGGSPTNAATYNSTFKTAVHAAGTEGGYFLNPNPTATKIKRLIFHTDTAVTTLTIYLASTDGSSDLLYTVYTGSSVTDYVAGDIDGLLVQPGESIIVLTTGATTALYCQIVWDADSDLVS